MSTRQKGQELFIRADKVMTDLQISRPLAYRFKIILIICNYFYCNILSTLNLYHGLDNFPFLHLIEFHKR